MKCFERELWMNVQYCNMLDSGLMNKYRRCGSDGVPGNSGFINCLISQATPLYFPYTSPAPCSSAPCSPCSPCSLLLLLPCSLLPCRSCGSDKVPGNTGFINCLISQATPLCRSHLIFQYSIICNAH